MKETPCQECGMPVSLGDDHPFAACLMFKGCHDGQLVKTIFADLKEQWIKVGIRQQQYKDKFKESKDGQQG